MKTQAIHWSTVISYHWEQENLSPAGEGRGRQYSGNRCLGLQTSSWWGPGGALLACSWAEISLPFLYFGYEGSRPSVLGAVILKSQKLASEKRLALRALVDLPSWFTPIWYLWALLRSINVVSVPPIGCQVSKWDSDERFLWSRPGRSIYCFASERGCPELQALQIYETAVPSTVISGLLAFTEKVWLLILQITFLM